MRGGGVRDPRTTLWDTATGQNEPVRGAVGHGACYLVQGRRARVGEGHESGCGRLTPHPWTREKTQKVVLPSGTWASWVATRFGRCLLKQRVAAPSCVVDGAV